MTDDRKRIADVMLGHLKTKGWPNMTDQQILNELKPMWVRLEESGLTLGIDFRTFVTIAHIKLREIVIFDQMRRGMF